MTETLLLTSWVGRFPCRGPGAPLSALSERSRVARLESRSRRAPDAVGVRRREDKVGAAASAGPMSAARPGNTADTAGSIASARALDTGPASSLHLCRRRARDAFHPGSARDTWNWRAHWPNTIDVSTCRIGSCPIGCKPFSSSGALGREGLLCPDASRGTTAAVSAVLPGRERTSASGAATDSLWPTANCFRDRVVKPAATNLPERSLCGRKRWS